MAHNFRGGFVVIKQGDDAVPISLQLSVCSSATANDGYLPYGTNISSVAVTSYKMDDDRTVTTDLIEAGYTTVANNIVYCRLQYPATNGTGYYGLKILMTLDDAAPTILRADHEKIQVV